MNMWRARAGNRLSFNDLYISVLSCPCKESLQICKHILQRTLMPRNHHGCAAILYEIKRLIGTIRTDKALLSYLKRFRGTKYQT